MTRTDFKSDRHAALDAVYPSDKRYCACGQGRQGECYCADEKPSKLWVPFWFAVAIVAGMLALTVAGVF